MKMDNSKRVKEFVIEMQDFFMGLSDEEKSLTQELNEVENIQEDLLHEIELADLNAIELMKVAKDLKANRILRRKIKDNLFLTSTTKSFVNRFIEKGILSEIKQLISNLDNYDNTIKGRGYTPRVLENLKCAKRK